MVKFLNIIEFRVKAIPEIWSAPLMSIWFWIYEMNKIFPLSYNEIDSLRWFLDKMMKSYRHFIVLFIPGVHQWKFVEITEIHQASFFKLKTKPSAPWTFARYYTPSIEREALFHGTFAFIMIPLCTMYTVLYCILKMWISPFEWWLAI